MDLRWRLVTWLSAFSVALFVAGVLMIGNALREDVAEEVEASAHLAQLMLSVHEAREGRPESLARLIAAGDLRHVTVSLERSRGDPAAPPRSGGILDWLANRVPDVPTQELRIPVGDDVLLVSANPKSEVREILREGLRMLAILLAFSLATIAAAWYAAHRALRPVRALEDGLERLAHGEPRAFLPSFELQEFRRIAQAIDRLAASLAESRAAEHMLARRLIDLQEAERGELARELHDEFGQSLTAIGVAAAFVERHAGAASPAALVGCARDIRGEVAKVSSHVRGLLGQLRPHGLEGLGMIEALSEVVASWRQRAAHIRLEMDWPESLPRLAPGASLALYRTLQEALTNVLRHSGGDRIRVSIGREPGGVRLTVADNGVGRAEDIRAGGGLLGMRERAEMAGGRFSVGDAREGGLRLELWLPAVDEEEICDDSDPVAR